MRNKAKILQLNCFPSLNSVWAGQSCTGVPTCPPMSLGHPGSTRLLARAKDLRCCRGSSFTNVTAAPFKKKNGIPPHSSSGNYFLRFVRSCPAPVARAVKVLQDRFYLSYRLIPGCCQARWVSKESKSRGRRRAEGRVQGQKGRGHHNPVNLRSVPHKGSFPEFRELVWII